MQSKIEWTECSWNPITGCDKISPGCKHCYAERMSMRLMQMPNQPNYSNGFQLTLQPHMLERPLLMKNPQRIVVNSMSDLFHENVPAEYVQNVFSVMNQAHWHQFQVLTKRSGRLLELAPTLTWSPNIWMGVSIESSQYLRRADDLRAVPAVIRFLSLEPLLGPLPNLNPNGIDWVIVGGESGPGCRPMKPEWVTEILDICKTAKVPFFFKQWGGIRKGKAGRTLHGRTYDEYPEVPDSNLRFQERESYESFRERAVELCGRVLA